MKRYCDLCMYAVKTFLEGGIDADDLNGGYEE